MKWLTATVLGGALVFGMNVSSQAMDWDYTFLPLRGTVEASIRRAGDALKTMGGQGRMQQRPFSVEMVWDPPEHRIEYSLSLIPWRKVDVHDALLLPPDAALRLSCTTIDGPPAAKTLCKEIEERYLKGP